MSEEKQKKIDTEKQVMPVLKQLARLYAVSYTHLDVYKRQHLDASFFIIRGIFRV